MKAVILDHFGEPAEVLSVRDVPTPTPGRGELLVRMLASPINPSDLMMVRGNYGLLPKLPATPGFEGVGVVEKSGGGLLGRFLGRQTRRRPWRRHRQLGTMVDREGQAGGAGAKFTADRAGCHVLCQSSHRIHHDAKVSRHQTGRSTSANCRRFSPRTDGDRSACAKTASFKVINVVRREDQGCGTEETPRGARRPCRRRTNLREKVKELTGGKGVRYAIDPVGGSLSTAVARCLGVGGRMFGDGTAAIKQLKSPIKPQVNAL